MQGIQSTIPNKFADLEYENPLLLCETGHFSFFHVRSKEGRTRLIKAPVQLHPPVSILRQLEHEFEVARELDPTRVIRPISIERSNSRMVLVLEDCPYSPLTSLIQTPLAVETFLRIAIGAVEALTAVHDKGLVHGNLMPEYLFATPHGQVKLTGFGLAYSSGRQGQVNQPSVLLLSSAPYLAPEQTGRMNRLVDFRSDLYALGVIFYRMLTGLLPFDASDPLAWVHCHIALAPLPPRERLDSVPQVLSEIILKLLEKSANDRYQTARGLKSDLQRCAQDWRIHQTITPFTLGENDVPDHLLIPQTLYGREQEVASLVDAFHRVAARGKPELVLVSGYSGVGKSTLVNELHKVLIDSQALYAVGKYDQYWHDRPYSTLAQAIRSLVNQILSLSEAEVAEWRETLQDAISPNGRLLTDLVPELGSLIGEQPQLQDVPPQDAQNRFNRTFRSLINVFARPKQPLVLFLDDLQWLDDATLNLLEHLIVHPDIKNLLLLGAYRDNEVGPKHPLRRTIESLLQADAAVHIIQLKPLAISELQHLVDDTFHCGEVNAQPLARMIFEKTGGNPFFVIQFLTELEEGGLVAFDARATRWHWNLDRIHAKGFSDSVTDLMITKLKRFSPQTLAYLKQLSCLGNKATIANLALIQGVPERETIAALQAAVFAGMLVHQDETVAFLHDRIQEAAYALIPKQDRKAAHLQIGRRLWRQASAEALNIHLFDVVNQLNRGVALISDTEERAALARLNARAAAKARSSIAYASACDYFAAAASLLPDSAWTSDYDFQFALHLDWAETEYLIGAFEQADRLVSKVLAKAKTDLHRASVYNLRVAVYPIAGRYDEAVSIGIEGLRLLGVIIPEDEASLKQAIEAEFAEVKSNLRGRDIGELVDEAETTDPKVRAITQLLSNMNGPAYSGSTPQIFPLLVLKGVNSALKYGLTKITTNAFSGFAILQASVYGDHNAAYAFSEAAIRLSERFNDIGQRGNALYLHGNHINFWLKPFSTDFPILQRGFDICLDSGSLAHANYIAYSIVWQAVERGDTLDKVLEFSRQYAEFALSSKNTAILQSIVLEQQFIKCLMGKTDGAVSFSDDNISELACVEKIEDASFTCGVTYYHLMKALVAILMDDTATARHHTEQAGKILPAVLSQPMEAMFYFLSALTLTHGYQKNSTTARTKTATTLLDYKHKLAYWAEHCPANFSAKHLLVAAEISEIEGDEHTAERQYDQAIEAARQEGFLHWEAMSNEAAARFHASRGFINASKDYLREARYVYARWGAEAKVKQLETRHPWLADEASVELRLLAAKAAHLDVMAIIKAQHAISSEIEQERLSETLLRIVMENAGAQKGYLYVAPDSELFAVAGDDGRIHYQRALTSQAYGMAQSIINYVRHAGTSVLLADARKDAGDFAKDEYLRQARPRSLLCLPIKRQHRLSGIVYLENNLTAGAFTADNLAVLETLVAQAAISLQNARTYRALQQSEARYRQLFETANEGIWIMDENADTVFANERMTEMMGCEHNELSGRNFTEFLFQENIPDHNLRSTNRKRGLSETYERRMRRKDGSELWTLISGAPIYHEDGRFHGSLAMFTDITERKQAEQRLATSERLFRTLAENAPINIARYDRKGRLIYFNPRLKSNFPLRFEAVRGLRPGEMSSEMARFQQAVTHTLETGKEGSYELEVPAVDGKVETHFITMVAERNEAGEIVGVLSTGLDITERKQAEDRLRLAASVFASSQEGILISDAQNRIIDVNPAFVRLTGYRRDEVIGRNPKLLSADRQSPGFYAEMWRSINTRGEWQGELWNRRKSGEIFAEQLSIVAVKDDQGQLQHYVGAFTDISPIKRHEADLDRIAHYDTLTSVPNRRLLGDRLEQAIARAQRHGMSLAVCYLDLDGFKPINDQFGHESGDLMLVEIARRLESLSRADDTVARLGGDEFVLLWNDVKSESECHGALERVLAKVTEPMLLEGQPVSVSASIGVTLYPEDDVDADSLLRHADHAMYSAKQQGKNCYQIFDAQMERQISARVEMLGIIRQGLDRGQFELYYQPKVNYVDGSVIGVEALLRWNDPTRGLLGPVEFLPCIENDRLAFLMGRWVIEQAVHQAKVWCDKDLDLPISINIFPRHLKYRNFIEDLRRILASHWPDMPKHRLLMEIVETTDLEELEPIEQVIKECVEMGIDFSLDDFGTGYSSLVYLRRLSIQELKIDQSFVRDMLEDPDDEAIVIGVISMGQAFGLRVVAEGVETARQAEHLVRLGCPVVQGYGLGHPMPAQSLEKWYADYHANRSKGVLPKPNSDNINTP